MQLSTDFEAGGADEDAITTTNTGFDSVSIGTGTTGVIDTGQAAHGTRGMRYATGATSALVYGAWTTSLGSPTRLYGRAYFRTATATPATSAAIVRGSASSTQKFRIAYDVTTGKVSIRNSANSAQSTSAAALPVNQWVRIEWDITAGTSAAYEVRIYTTADSTGSPTETLSGSAANFGSGAFDEVRFGQAAGASNVPTCWLDDCLVNDTGFPGPVSSNQTLSAVGGIASGEAFGGPTVTRSGGLLLATNFEGGGADEDTITAGNTGFDSVSIGSGATAVIDTAHPAHGTRGMRYSTTGSAALSYGAWNTSLGSGLARLYGRAYLYLTATPGVITAFVRGSTGATQKFRLGIDTDGTVVVRNTASTIVAATAAAIPLNQWIRVEWDVGTGAAGAYDVRVWHNADAGGSPTQALTGTADFATGDYDEVRFGQGASTANVPATWLDDVAVSDSGFPGPAPYITPTGIASGEAFGTPTISVGGQVMPTGIPTAEAFGAPAVYRPGTLTHAWQGSPTASSVQVAAKVSGATAVSLRVATDSGMTTGVLTGSTVTPDGDGYAKISVTGLAANTLYYYRVMDTPAGGPALGMGPVRRIRTLPAASGAQSFTFGFGGCSQSGTTQSAALDGIRARVLAGTMGWFLHLGDFHYSGSSSTSQSVHAAAWATQIAGATGMSDFVADVPMFYARSDHDSTNVDNGDSNTANNAASMLAYQQVFAHAALADSRNPKIGLYQAWTVGRVRFILLDVRNGDRSTGSGAQSTSKTLLGSTQKAWLKTELDRAELLKVIISDVQWIGPSDSSVLTDKPDYWGSYNDERTEIGQYITDHQANVLLLHSDAHSLVCDTGTHNTWGGFPIYGSAPLANAGGGRYITGNYTGIYNVGSGTQASQYAVVEVTDDGTTITTTYRGWDALTDTQKITQTDTFVAPGRTATATAGATAAAARGALTVTRSASATPGTLSADATRAQALPRPAASSAPASAAVSRGTITYTRSTSASAPASASASTAVGGSASRVAAAAASVAATAAKGPTSRPRTAAATAGATAAAVGTGQRVIRSEPGRTTWTPPRRRWAGRVPLPQGR